MNETSQTSEVATALSLPQAAAYLNVHNATIRRWIKAGQLPAVRVGTEGSFRYRVRREDLDGMVKAA